jgi:hypothetical protein
LLFKSKWGGNLFYVIRANFITFFAPRPTKIDFLLDKKLEKIHKFTGQIYILLDKLVFFAGQKIPNKYDLFTGQKD